MVRETELIPLFPLKSVLFPGGRVPLQIFEPRYIDLMTRCLKAGTGFGICLISEGEEVIRSGDRQRVSRVGTYANIVDWDRLPNGLLGVTVEGCHKFRVRDCWARDDKLLMATVQWCAEDYLGQSPLPMTPDQDRLVALLKDLLAHPLVESLRLETDFTDRRHLAWRLAELLPVPLHEKQKLLELDDTAERLEEIENLVVSVMRYQ